MLLLVFLLGTVSVTANVTVSVTVNVTLSVTVSVPFSVTVSVTVSVTASVTATVTKMKRSLCTTRSSSTRQRCGSIHSYAGPCLEIQLLYSCQEEPPLPAQKRLSRPLNPSGCTGE